MVEVSKDGLDAARYAYGVEWYKVPDGTHAFIRAETAALAAIASLQAERDRYRVLVERASEELRLLRSKDTGAVYDIGLRSDLHAALSDTPTVQS